MRIMPICIFVALSAISICSRAGQECDGAVRYGVNSIRLAILNSVNISSPPNDAGGLLVFLGGVDDDNARILLVEMTSYYLGSSVGEALFYSVLKQGNKILPGLREALERPVSCDGELMNSLASVKCLSIDDREALIRKLIMMIESKKTLEYFP